MPSWRLCAIINVINIAPSSITTAHYDQEPWKIHWLSHDSFLREEKSMVKNAVSSEHDTGTWWEDNPRHNHPRHQPAPRADRLPMSPIPHVPPFPRTELQHASSPHRVVVPSPGLGWSWGWGWGPELSCRMLRLHLAPGLPPPPVHCFIQRCFPVLLLNNAHTVLQRNKRRQKERSLVFVIFLQSKN